MNLLADIYSNFNSFLLVFARMSGLFFITPIFGRRNVPNIVKIGFSVLLTYIVVSYMSVQPIEFKTILEYSFFVVKELLIGIIIGFITSITFSAILVAGQIIDTQIGFGIVHVMDPNSNMQVPLMGNLKNVIAMVVFFVLNGHHTLIKIVIDSFYVVPLGKAVIRPEITNVIIMVFIDFFTLGVKIAVPVIAAAFLAEVGLGIMVRVVPQMNVFVIGIPLKIIVGLIVLFFFVPIYINMLNGTFDKMFSYITEVISGLKI